MACQVLRAAALIAAAHAQIGGLEAWLRVGHFAQLHGAQHSTAQHSTAVIHHSVAAPLFEAPGQSFAV